MGNKGMIRGFGVSLLVTMLLGGCWSLAERFVPPFAGWLTGLGQPSWLIQGGVLFLFYLVLGWILRARLKGERPRLNKLAGWLVVGAMVLVIGLVVPQVWPENTAAPEAAEDLVAPVSADVPADSTAVAVDTLEALVDTTQTPAGTVE